MILFDFIVVSAIFYALWRLLLLYLWLVFGPENQR